MKVGDRVRLRPDINDEFEEAKQGKVYVISEVGESRAFGPFAQLKGIYSSYHLTSLVLVPKKKRSKLDG
jgi:hypothetical protein